MVALLVQNMERLDEQVKEEADGIYNNLGKETLIQNLSNETPISSCPQVNCHHTQEEKT